MLKQLREAFEEGAWVDPHAYLLLAWIVTGFSAVLALMAVRPWIDPLFADGIPMGIVRFLGALALIGGILIPASLFTRWIKRHEVAYPAKRHKK